MEVHSSTSSHPSPARFICQEAVASFKMVVRIQSRDAVRNIKCSIMEFASPFPNIHRHASTQYVLLGSTVCFTILSHSEFAGSGLHSNGSGVVSIQCVPTSQFILSNRISIRQLLIPSPPYFGGHVHVKDPGVLTQVALGT